MKAKENLYLLLSTHQKNPHLSIFEEKRGCYPSSLSNTFFEVSRVIFYNIISKKFVMFKMFFYFDRLMECKCINCCILNNTAPHVNDLPIFMPNYIHAVRIFVFLMLSVKLTSPILGYWAASVYYRCDKIRFFIYQ